MGRLGQLHQHPLHKQVESMPFMLRLRLKAMDKPHIVDLMNLSIQMVFLYEAMEQRLQALLKDGVDPSLAFFNQAPWLNRSEKLRTEIEQMAERLSRQEQASLNLKTMPALSAWIERIKHFNALELFACLSVQCLRDVFEGRAFVGYSQPARIARISKHVNELQMSADAEATFFKTAEDVFKAHIELLRDMESSCSVQTVVATSSTPLRQCSMFAVAAVAAAITAGLYYQFNL